MTRSAPELDVIGLTTVFGNAATDITNRDALLQLEAAGRGDIPVARRARGPVAGHYLGPVPQVHGHNGLGDAPLRVETESISRGKTWAKLGNTDDEVPPAWRGRPRVTVCTAADEPRVAAWWNPPDQMTCDVAPQPSHAQPSARLAP